MHIEKADGTCEEMGLVFWHHDKDTARDIAKFLAQKLPAGAKAHYEVVEQSPWQEYNSEAAGV